MKLNQILAVSLQSLKSNRLRTFLTILGVVVGIFSVIVIMTIMTMLQNSIEEGISFFGKNTFQIQKWPAVRTGDHSSWQKYRNRKDITIEEYFDFKEVFNEAEAVAAEQSRWGRILKYENEKTKPNVYVGNKLQISNEYDGGDDRM